MKSCLTWHCAADFAVFSGIGRTVSSMCCKTPIRNPEGIESFSPGLARFREGLPWVTAVKFQNPERVEYYVWLMKVKFACLLPLLHRLVEERVGERRLFALHEPAVVEYQFLMTQMQPFQGSNNYIFLPRAARGSQPWAECSNPFGIGNTSANHPNTTRYSTESCEGYEG